MTNWNRRQILCSAGAGVATLALAPLALRAQEKEKGKFDLPPLPYPYDALAPTISEKTMKFHHDVHHQAYVNNANNLLKDHPELIALGARGILSDVSKVPEKVRQGVINNVGGHSNHTIFWQIMGPKGKGGSGPEGTLLEAINSTFSSADGLKKVLNDKAKTLFGSGWAWLVLNKEGKLEVIQRPNQNSPYLTGHQPILGIDVWEHAYYVDYGPARPKYVEAWWDVVNWKAVADRYTRASKGA